MVRIARILRRALPPHAGAPGAGGTPGSCYFTRFLGVVLVARQLATVSDRPLPQVDLWVEAHRRLAHGQSHELRFCWRAW